MARGGDRASRSWSQLSPLLVLITACGFPRPADVADSDASTGCVRDEDCGGSTPFCAGGVCAICKASTSCPASRPVCDTASHDCRTCAKDSECDSGACDLGAGTCVDQGAILYASPSGALADACTRAAPCSLARAAAAVDANHSYIVMFPGTYTGGATFDGKKATVVGANATIDIPSDAAPRILVFGGASVYMRDIQITEHLGTSGELQAIYCSSSPTDTLETVLTIENIQASTHNIDVLGTSNSVTITIRHSTIGAGSVSVTGHLVIDRSQFLDGGPSVSGTADITNSVIISNVRPAIQIGLWSDPNITNVSNNTFIGGDFLCENQGTNSFHSFDGNLIYNHGSIQANNNCTFIYNLITPDTTLGGAGNFQNRTGDPLFVDEQNKDFHLKPGSPAIDAADPGFLGGHDYDGTPRPQGPRSDIGAFEYVP